jgi:hypothetical protein
VSSQVANAVEVILPGEHPWKKDAPKGEMDYLSKPDFGKAPAYLEAVKADIDRERTIIDEYLRETEYDPEVCVWWAVVTL